MNLNKFILKSAVLGVAVASILSSGCTPKKGEEPKEKVDSTQATFLKLDNAIFSIPSPIQTSLLIKKSGANYNKSLLNQTNKVSGYATAYKKALNLGVFGADLGYVAIYDQNQDAIAYLNATRKLADDLGVSAAFDENLMKRFQANLGKKDSLILLVSDGMRASDSYLQNNERKNVAGLIIAGGWVEGLYFSLNVAKETNNKEVINRIGEQKSTLDNLIKLLTPYYEQPEYKELLDQLIDLAYDFDAVENKYTYVPANTDAATKTTTINSISEIVITKAQMENISKKINTIRTSIIG